MADLKFRYIPEDLLMKEILPWLPVKSLMRFRCVCKLWCDLFRNQDFMTEHYRRQTALNNENVMVNHSVCGENCISFLSLNNDGEIRIKERICSPFAGSLMDRPTVFGPCNGVFCLFEASFPGQLEIALWNPAIREFKRLPSSLMYRLSDLDNYYLHNMGFGFDSKTNDYKVIILASNEDDEENPKHWVALFSLKTNSWREISYPREVLSPKDKNLSVDIDLFNTYINGVCYWLGYGANSAWILSFDMSSEVFEIVRMPDLGFFKYRIALAVFRGSLAIIGYPDYDGYRDYFDIWVMTEQGTKKSWDKLLIVESFVRFKSPVGFWKNGEVCFEDVHGQLVLYVPATEGMKELQLKGAKCNYNSQVLNYVESLFPINGRREDEDEAIIRTKTHW